MAWTTILASQTDADSPLNQVLFDAIRENLNYLKSQIDEVDLTSVRLGGISGAPVSATQTAYALSQGQQTQLGEVFDLLAPPSGKKWRFEFKGKARKTSGTTVKVRMYLKNENDAEVAYSDSAALTTSFAELSIALDLTSALRGRLAAGLRH